MNTQRQIKHLRQTYGDEETDKLLSEVIEKKTEGYGLRNFIRVILSRELQLPYKDIKGKKRIPQILRARRLLAYLLYTYTDMQYLEIGIVIGGVSERTTARDVSIIRKLINALENSIEFKQNKEFIQQINSVEFQIQNIIKA